MALNTDFHDMKYYRLGGMSPPPLDPRLAEKNDVSIGNISDVDNGRDKYATIGFAKYIYRKLGF